jgi:hypothetical protein
MLDAAIRWGLLEQACRNRQVRPQTRQRRRRQSVFRYGRQGYSRRPARMLETTRMTHRDISLRAAVLTAGPVIGPNQKHAFLAWPEAGAPSTASQAD